MRPTVRPSVLLPLLLLRPLPLLVSLAACQDGPPPTGVVSSHSQSFRAGEAFAVGSRVDGGACLASVYAEPHWSAHNPDSTRALYIACFDETATAVWQRRFELFFGDSRGVSIATTAEGDVLVALSSFRREAWFDDQQVSGVAYATEAPYGLWLRLAADDGAVVWARALGPALNAGALSPQDIAVDAGGRALLVGRDQSAGGARLLCYGMDTADGAALWQRRFDIGPQPTARVAANETRAVVGLVSRRAGALLPGELVALRTADGTVFFRQPTANLAWAPLDVAISRDGNNLYAAYTPLLGGEGAEQAVAVVEQYRGTDGAHGWTWVLGDGSGSGFAYAPYIAAAGSDVIAVGVFGGEVLVGERHFETIDPAAYLLRLDPAGASVWSRYLVDALPMLGVDLAIGFDEQVWVGAVVAQNFDDDGRLHLVQVRP